MKGKPYRLIYQMNKNVRVRVQTPVGVSQSADVGPSVAQGSVDGPIISSVSIGNEVHDAFAADHGDHEVMYGSLSLSALIWMDDILRMATTTANAQFGNNLIDKIVGNKGLELNLDKSTFIVMGGQKARKKIKNQIEKCPLTLGESVMKE